MLVTIFSSDKNALKELAVKICSSGLVYPQYGMYMIQAFVEKASDLRDCFTMPTEDSACNYANAIRGAMVAYVPDKSKLER